MGRELKILKQLEIFGVDIRNLNPVLLSQYFAPKTLLKI